MKKIYPYFQILIVITLTHFQSNAQEKPNPFSIKKKPVSSAQFHFPVTTINNENTNQAHCSYKPLKISKPNDSLKSLKIHRSDKGVPIYIKGGMNKKFTNLRNKENLIAACHSYLKSISSLIGIKNPESEFTINAIHQDSKGEQHVRLNQQYSGIPVFGAQIILHFRGDSIHLFNGRHFPSPGTSDVNPGFTASYAIQKSIEDLRSLTSYRQLSPEQMKLLNYNGPGSELVLYQPYEKNNLKLAWHITLRPNLLEDWEYFINAKSGGIIYKSNRTCTTGPATANATDLNGVNRTLNTYLQGTTYYMLDASKPMFNLAQSPNMPDNPVGAIWTLDAQNTDLTSLNQITSSNNTWPDASAVSAHFNAGVCYDYYKNTFSRNSLDNQGGTIISVVNVTDGGSSMENAYWNGQFMAYGNGGTYFKPLAGGLDVAAHELTHGVISKTANLSYSYQSGGINESMADIFGCMVDRGDWQIGEDIVMASAFPSGALRDLSDPHNGSSPGNFRWQPKTMSEFVNTTSDHGGVHVNSGIPNYAYYLFASSASVGVSIAEQVYYRALTTYLVKSSQFIDLRLAVIQAADDLYPSGSLVSNAARAAFDAVEIFDGPPTPTQVELPTNTGNGYLLFENTIIGNPNTLYIKDLVTGTVTPISTTPVSQKPSVTDDGSIAYFVSKDHNIISITLSVSSPQENVIDAQGIWDNVAVSKDGTKLAATTTSSDSSIFVYEFASTQWTRFHLYNPTYTSGIITDGPIYADALEWDYTGEYVIYDCFNQVPAGSSNIDYWDIGRIRVWDKTNGVPGDGNIEKLFNQLPANVDIGNPAFAKNSPDIIAFDYIDYDAGAIWVLACNTQTLETDQIFQNSTLGFPNFSTTDGELAFTVGYSPGDTLIASVQLDPSKIHPNSLQAYLVRDNARMPVYFAKGNRPTGNSNPNAAQPSIHVFPNPFDDQVFIQYELLKNDKIDISLYNTLGQSILNLFSGSQTLGLHKLQFSLESLSPGTYFIKIQSGSDLQTFKIIKLQ